MKVFLGGTVAGSKWRDYVMPRLEIEYFNPVVADWNEEAYQRELHEREHCPYCLYVLTPHMEGVYSIAEVADDSFKKSDKTIFCYLPIDDDREFTPQQIQELDDVGRLIQANGGIWKRSLDEVIAYLNSAKQVVEVDSHDFKNVFISYGRRHSIAFARQLYKGLRDLNYRVWFDMNDIPLGVDFQEQIDEGIKRADNFVFVMSPHSVKSVYCYKEVILAINYGKRIIPILHIEPSDCWDKIHPNIQKLNWIYMRQKEDFSKSLDQWDWVDDYDKGFKGLISLIEMHKDYTIKHTQLLTEAIEWNKIQRSASLLLSGDERQEAEKWLLKKRFYNEQNIEVQPPCFPTDIQSEFIAESKKMAHNRATQVFLGYAKEDYEVKEKIRFTLARHNFTSWSDTTDIRKGEDFEASILRGIENADSLVVLLSPHSVASQYCLKEIEYAVGLNKRIVPIMITHVTDEQLPIQLRKIQYIDFTDRTEKVAVEVKGHDDVAADVAARKQKSPFEKSVDELLAILNSDYQYYEQHKHILTQAIKWERLGKIQSTLMRGYGLESAQAWLQVSKQKTHRATILHEQYVAASEAAVGTISTQVFLCYAPADGDFVNMLNEELQSNNKTTWFDKENIDSKSDVKAESIKALAQAENFVFVVSKYSLENPFCLEILENALKLNKRCLFLSHRRKSKDASLNLLVVAFEGKPQEYASAIKDATVVDFEQQTFTKAFAELIQVLDTDREHLQMHTRVLERAIDWERANRADDLLMRGNEFKLASDWLQVAVEKQKSPRPSPLQQEYLDRSNKAIIIALREARQQRLIRLMLWIIGASLVLVAFLAIFAEMKRRDAERDRNIAKEQRDKADSLRILADKRKQVAEEKSELAKKSADTARQQKLIADSMRNIAQQNLDTAKKQKQIADAMRKLAERKADTAKLMSERAIRNAKSADSARKLAVEAQQRTIYNLYNFNSTHFALKAIDVNNDKTLKAELALTSYALRKEAERLAQKNNFELDFEPAILAGMVDAMFDLNTPLLSNEEVWNMKVVNNQIVYCDTKRYLQLATLTETDVKTFPKLTLNNSILDANAIGVNMLSASTDARNVLYNTNGSNFVWQQNNGSTWKSTLVPSEKAYAATSVYWDAQNIFLFNDDDRIKRLNLDGNVVDIIQVEDLRHMIPHKDGILVFNDKSISRVENALTTPTLRQDIYKQDVAIYSTAYNTNLNMLMLGGINGQLFVLNIDNSNPPIISRTGLLPKSHNGIVSSIAFSANGKWIATGSFDGTVMLWNIEQMKKKGLTNMEPVIFRDYDRVLSVCFAPSDNYLIVCAGKTIRILPVETSIIYDKLKANVSPATSLPDASWEYYKRGDIDKPSF